MNRQRTIIAAQIDAKKIRLGSKAYADELLASLKTHGKNNRNNKEQQG
jgi:hypothetical protein